MKQKAVIVFVKNPEPGKVKTKLAKDIGDTAAADAYKQLLQHTHDELLKVDADKFVFYLGDVNRLDLWENTLFYKQVQHGKDFGERMQHAFAFLFQLQYEKVLMIHSDSPQLTSNHLQEAFDLLRTNDVCIGPNMNGAYYLLGLRSVFAPFFINKEWNSQAVYNSTLEDAATAGLTVATVDQLRVVDTLNDWLELKHLLKDQKTSPLEK
jgi:rSAM/selenodomain-associated transferase 1